MKRSFFKILFYSALAAVTLSSCAKDAGVDSDANNGSRVPVRIIADVQSRAANDLWDTGDKIGLTMILPIPETVVEPYRNFGYTHSSGGNFSPITSGDILYFPTDGSQVVFRGYYPYAETLPVNLQYSISTKDQRVLADIDFMTVEERETFSAADPNVHLYFRHRLSKLDINLSVDGMNDAQALAFLQGATVAIKGMKTEASYDLIHEVLTVDAASVSDMTLAVNNAKADAIVLPSANVAGVELEVSTSNGGKYTAVFSDMELLEGYRYILNIRLKTPAEISAEIVPWTGGPTRDMDVVRIVTGLGQNKDFNTDDIVDLYIKDAVSGDFSLLRKYTLMADGKWQPESPLYWEGIPGDNATFRATSVIAPRLNSTQIDDILVAPDIDVDHFTGINLAFGHAGSKVMIELLSGDGTYTPQDLNAASVILPNYLNTASVDAQGNFVIGSPREDITFTGKTAIIPPQTIAQGDNMLTVEIGGRTYEVKAEDAGGFVYEKGTAYIFRLDIRKAKVEISARIVDWEEETVEFNEIRIGSATFAFDNEEGVLDNDELVLFTGDVAGRTRVPGSFSFDGLTRLWGYSGPSAPLYWEDIADAGHIYASITRPAVYPAAGNNQSEDYITADPIENRAGVPNTAINLTLSHKVAKVNVILRSSTYGQDKLQNANITLPGYAIGGRLDNGIYVPGNQFGPIRLDKPVEVTDNPSGTGVTYQAASYLQPQTIAIGSGLVTIEIDGRTYNVTPDQIVGGAADIAYEAGKVTHLIITIEKSALNISAQVTDWTDMPAIEFNDALFFSVNNIESSGFVHADQLRFYQLATGGNAVSANNNVYLYSGATVQGTLTSSTPWYRDDFQTGDLIAGVFPASAPNMAAGAGSFAWTCKSADPTNAHTDDIMVATANPARNLGLIQSGVGDVAFEFKHVLSKVTVNLLPGEGFTPAEIMPATVAINNMQLSGNISIVTGIATPNAVVTPAFNPTKLALPNAITGKTVVSSYEAFVMPQTISAGTVFITVTINGVPFEAKLSVAKDLAAGAHNAFNITLNKTGAELTATVVDWNREPDTDIELH